MGQHEPWERDGPYTEMRLLPGDLNLHKHGAMQPVRQKLRITFLLPGRGLFGGIRVVVIYGNSLLQRGHDVTILILREGVEGGPRAVARRLQRAGRRILGLDRDHLDAFAGKVASVHVKDLCRITPDGDAVVATHWLTAGPIAELPTRKGRKFYFIQHYETHSFEGDKVDATWRLPMQKIVVAKWLQEIAKVRFNDGEALLVPNAVDHAQFDAGPRDPHGPPCVGLMYSVAPWKGVATAFEAIRLARRQIPELQVVSFGAVPLNADVPAPPNTTFYLRPDQHDLRHIYAEADVWLCASETEGFGLPPLEAMACRCPVVCTRCGGPEDFVEEGHNGFLVDVGDADAMADRLVTLISDKSLLRRMSDAAYETASRFDWDQSALLFEKALLERSTRCREG